MYRARWNAELNLKSLQQTMQMHILRCKTPELVWKNIWTHILGYNLIRTVIAQAGNKTMDLSIPPGESCELANEASLVHWK